MAPGVDGYETDFHAWALGQASLLREGRLSEIDADHVAEEIESLGRSEKRELVSRLGVLLAHLLKWQAQPARRGTSWELTIQEQRRKLARHLNDNPSLRGKLDDAVADAYGDALLVARRETGLAAASFPPACPWARDEILAETFLPL